MISVVRHLDLFSGIGGFSLAASMVGGIETIGFCEIDPWCQRVLRKNFPRVPIHDDIRTVEVEPYGRIDLITGGYPCQPFSVAGQRRGQEDARYLWPEMCRLIESARPRWILAENVAGHVRMGLDEVLADLDSIGYASTATVIPACGVGAIHRRDRVWIIAHDSGFGVQRGIQAEISGFEGLQGRKDGRSFALVGGLPAVPSSGLCRASDGVSCRVDRLRGLGNSIVPSVAAEILRCMMHVDQLYSRA